MRERERERRPQIRFEGFESEWEKEKIDDVSKIYGGINIKDKKHLNIGNNYFIDYLNVFNNTFVDLNKYRKFLKTREENKLITGDVLLTVSSETPEEVATSSVFINNSINKNKDFYLNSFCLILRFNDLTNLSPHYLGYFFRSNFFRKQVLIGAQGISRYNINQKYIKSSLLLKPKLSEQQKIAKLFTTLDNVIKLNKQKLEKLQNIKKELLQKMFADKNNLVPKIRFKEFESEWEKICLKDYCEFLSGKGLSLEEVKKYGFVKCIHYGSLYTDYGMIIKEVIHKTKSIKNNSFFSQYGDVLIPASDTTPTGLARASSVLEKDVLIGGDINVIRPNKSILLGSFLSLNINYNKQKLIPLIKGTSVKHIHNSDIKNIEIFFTNNLDEQQKIAKLFTTLDNVIKLNKQKLEKLQNIKKELLQKMFV
ncbi:restriction endonuclease subunit S [Mycoplasma leonicaptivi]|uniref:restriction endonuclease subunit S n=1 Tax=Mycoplasma leonicaptivi TaxID=36742 RepID=UPI000A06B411|nr:restriction endonuclease subunit S [Mycoplasma leonicaptivi]